jgi:hypothetical protein
MVMKKRGWFLLFLILLLSLMSSGCNLPVGTANTSSVETAVAATLAGLPATAIASAPEASSTPTKESTLSPTETPLAATPFCVSFVDSARNLYTWTEGSASPVQLVNSGDVVQSYVSPDGSLIAYSRSADYSTYELDVINSDGSNPRVLISSAQLAALPRPADSLGLAPDLIRWIPNTHRLGISFRVLFEGPGLSVLNAFYTLDADNGAFSQLLTPGQDYGFTYSPDGNWLTISRPTGIDLYTAAGALVKADVITYDFVNTASEYAWVAVPAWKNDSSAFSAAVPPAEPWVDSPADTLVWTVTTAGISTKTFTGSMSFFPGGIASYSPDLSQMAFRKQEGPSADNKWTLHVLALNGKSDTVLDSGYFNQLPVWSTDGKKDIYSKLAGSVNETYLAIQGLAPILIPDSGSLLDIRWMDDANYIISSRTDTGTSLLYGSIDGNLTKVVYSDPGSTDYQTFSFDVNR